MKIATFSAMLLLPLTLVAQDAPDPLASLNGIFRTWYAAEKSRRLEHPGPVVMVKGDALVFLRNGERKEVPLIPSGYHRLKAVSHIPLALAVKLGPLTGKSLGAADLAALRGYLATLHAAMSAVGKGSLLPAALARSQRIAAASWLLLESTVDKGVVSEKALRTYLRFMSPLVLAEARDAAAMQLDALDGNMRAWRGDLTPGEWRGFHVVLMGAHMAREQEITMQYFLRLTGEKREGRRVIFLEGHWDEAKALDLLATHLVDADVGRDFFGDPMRMHRDLLSDAAKEWLNAHPPWWRNLPMARSGR